ncbi:MAG: protein kinase [Planctomycetaceae bacterium]|nr:protein kinase [Planctomycetaceae bacterium]
MLSSAREQRPSLDERPPLAVELDGATGTSSYELPAVAPLALIGRGTHCDIRLEDVEVSRRHALLVRWGDGVFVADLGSHAGTHFHPGGTGHGWIAKGVAVAIGPYRLRTRAETVVDGRDLALHRDLLPFDRSHDWQLQFVSGEVQPGAYTLRRPLTLIGRRSPCKVQLKLPEIKSVHAALLVAPDGLFLRDLSGRSAVRVDGEPWLQGWLNDGQVVELGPVRIRVSKVAPVLSMRSSEAETDDPAGSMTQESLQPVAAEEPAVPPAEADSSRLLTQPLLSGRYRILKRIARGGMGVVYEGLDVRLHRPVAIKVVRGKGDATRLGRQRLLREAMVSARVDHPNIVRVLDADRDGRYAVFEYVAGETLGDTLRRTGRFSPVQAATWMAQVADAIEQLGLHGIVHRDIKPANVLVTPTGVAKLVDFGLAFLRDAGDSATLAHLTEETERPRRGIAIGTAPFASPEQFDHAQSVDTRSDIYSAGCTLYSLLAGRPPFFGTPSETCRLHRESVPPPIPKLPPRLFAIIEKALAKSPDDRHQTGAELAGALRAFAAESPTL